MRAGSRGYLQPVGLGLLIMLATLGCPSVPRQTGFMTQLDELQVSATELRTRAVHFARREATIIELAADSIRALSADPAVRREALLWKAYSLPVLQEASLRADPLLALVDLGAYNLQMRQYYTEGRGKGAFGEYEPIALDALGKIQAIGDQLTRAVTVEGQVSQSREQLRADLRAWVADHPIEGHLDSRASIVFDWAEYLEGGSGLGTAVGSMEQALGRLEDRAGFLNEYMLKQAGWQAELAIEELMQSQGLTPATRFLEVTTALVDSAPELLERERTALLDDISKERAAVMAVVESEIDRMLQAVTAEREAVLAAISIEREAVLRAITAERTAAFEALDQLVDGALADSRAVADYVLWRVTLMAIGLGIVAVIGYAVVNRMRRRGPSADSTPTF